MKVLFMGRKKVSADSLEWLLTLPSAEVVGVITDSHLAASPTAALAVKRGLPLHTFESALTAMKMGKLTFDLGLSMLYWRKLKDQFLTVPRFGVVNFHPAPLPEYKGVGGYNLAILNALPSWSVTAHFVDATIDTGPIIGELSFKIDPSHETAQSLERTSQVWLRQLFEATVAKILACPDCVSTIPNGPGRYVSRPELEGMKKVDFAKDDVDRKVRAFWFPPYDGAYVEHNGQKFTLANRSILESLADPATSSLFSPRAPLKDVKAD
jgi:methionyl-tRNA formyltransferase